MKGSELLRLVGLNINQNKFKTIMTSIGIVVGAATIVLVIGIGRGGQMDVAEQFAELNAGAIDISYDYAGEEESSGGGSFFDGIGQMFGNIGNMIGGFFGGGGGNAPGGNASGDGSAASGSTDSGAAGDTNSFSDGPGGGFSGTMPGNFDFSGSGSTDSSSGSTDGSSGADFSGGGPGGSFPGSDFSGTAPGGAGDNSADSGNSSDGSGTDSQNSPDGNVGNNTDSSSVPDGSGTDGQNAGGGNGNTADSNGNAGNAADSSENVGNTADSNGNGADNKNAGSGADNGNVGGGPDAGNADGGTDSANASDGTDSDSGSSAAEGDSEDTTSAVADRLNQENIILTQDDVEDIERYVSGISGATITYSTRASIEGANLTSAQTYTVAGVKENYADLSKLTLSAGDFLTEEDDELKERVCVLGATAAEELFGDSEDIVDSTIYIADRTYTVVGVLNQSSTVSSGISVDTAILIPYETGIKYVTGESIDPTLTVVAEDVNVLDSVISDVRTVLEENYDNAEFTFEDSGSKMEAAQSSNKTLTMLLSAMAAIVFLVGGIGIMNVLFVSVKERTNEIGILKAIGTSRTDILIEFLVESAAISCIGGILGVALSFGVIPIVEKFDVRVEVTTYACLAALGFAVLTGTIFGIYPAWKASRLEPVEALNAE